MALGVFCLISHVMEKYDFCAVVFQRLVTSFLDIKGQLWCDLLILDFSFTAIFLNSDVPVVASCL